MDAAPPTLAPFHDESATTLQVAVWTADDRVVKNGGDTIASSAFSGPITLPRKELLARQRDFTVDLATALDRIEARARAAYAARSEALVADLTARERQVARGSIVGARIDTTLVYVQLAADHRTMTISAWPTITVQVQGPLVKAPPAHCLPGQPCAQMADYRPQDQLSVGFGLRWVITSDGALAQEIVYAQRGEGPAR